MKIRFAPLAAAGALALTLSACSSGADGGKAAAGRDTLAAALDDSPDMTDVTMALEATGIGDALAGKASYTLLAPVDDAFAPMGDINAMAGSEEGRPALAALLRDHIVPGYVTPGDIAAALKAHGGAVAMRTLGDNEVKFARAADGAITVTAANGVTAKLTEEPIEAGSSIALPVDHVLKAMG